ncbi:ATP-binding cassette domain-containing protein [Blastopirellula sp. J2-11]|uniref:peptidase domain-containing ABC transporter n=1 Tax=Blastopirellula sp. J2-11 TaxID=2943192 RepID=UPI0021C9DA51|nr:ATP-binding cassette domain-containing protein [Blastopirellula sp. J2-11]UUO04872.1 ATP-binding cassette domain-containing protein [Blastopirellula sp. J2-11]
MPENQSDPLPNMPSQNAIHVLEAFSNSAQISFDRILAARALGEDRDISGEDWQTWSRRLIEAGEALGLRIRSLDSPLKDALIFVEQGIPVATYIERSEAELELILIKEVRGNRLRVTGVKADETDAWIKIKELNRRLGLTDEDTTCCWVVGQAALACESPKSSSHHGPDHHLSPFARLLGLLKPEKKDIWVILVFSIVVGVLALATPIAVEALVNTVAFGRYLQPVIVLVIMLFTFLAFAAAMKGLLTFLVEIIQRRFFVRVVEDLAYRLPRVEQKSFDNLHGPELVNRFFDVVSVQKSFAVLLLDGIALVLQTIIGMIVLAFYHPFLLGFDVVLICLIAFAIFGLGRGAVTTSIKESKAKYAVAAWLQELARHPTAFKLNSGAQFALDRADQLAIDWLDSRRSHFRVLMRQILFALGLQACAATTLLGLGGWLVIVGELTLGQLVAAELIVMIIVGGFAKLGKHLDSFYDLLASVDKLGYLFDLPTESRESLFQVGDNAPASVELSNVTYKFDSQTAVKNLSLRLAPGESVALVGPAASGKSTVIDLLCSIRLPTTGHIKLDGVDLRELRTGSMRDNIAVARGIEIFSGTINENVHLNRSHLSSLDVHESLEMVGLLDEFLQLPAGLGTPLSTNGASLSTSQAARLMLARAIIGRPRLLLIDGVLDVLPDDLAAELMDNLSQHKSSWTLLTATGRRSVADACDRRFVLCDDEIRQEN